MKMKPEVGVMLQQVKKATLPPGVRRKTLKRMFLTVPQKETTLPGPWFWTSSL